MMTALVNDESPSDGLSQTELALIERMEPDQILKMVQQSDQFRFYDDLKQVKIQIAHFGGVFSKENLKNHQNIELLTSLVDRLEQLRNSSFSDAIEIISEEGVRGVLSEDDQAAIEVIEAQIKEGKERIEIASVAYQKVLVLNKLLPNLGKIIEGNNPITKERVLEAYYQIELVAIQVDMIKKLLESKQGVILEVMLSK